ncbi:uncharacterized protein [Drosophila bipectinata]|uniref:uncharacterized protein n=1 Tax=Drosophila bipectinata TaxID=42026 RepID=UPI001C896F1C|nr:uncharacterized protein LOC108122915 [Drosophila bipectinata]
MNQEDNNEPSIDGCIQVAFGARVREQPETAKNCAKACFNLCGKPSFIVCKGKKSPDLIEVDSESDLRKVPPIKFSYEDTSLRVQDIIECQENIIRTVEGAQKKIIEETNSK